MVVIDKSDTVWYAPYLHPTSAQRATALTQPLILGLLDGSTKAKDLCTWKQVSLTGKIDAAFLAFNGFTDPSSFSSYIHNASSSGK